MGPLLIVLAVIVVIALIAVAASVHAQRERERKATLLQWAAHEGFIYHDDDPWNLDARFRGVRDIGRGHSRYAFEVLAREMPAPAFIFRYHFRTTETRTVTRTDSRGNTYTTTETYEQDHWRRYLIVELNASFPSLAIRREGLFDKLAALVGFDDINFESEAFSRRYHCKSDRRDFAYAVIHPQMMQWLMDQPFTAELADHLFIMDLSSTGHDAATCAAAWEAARGFINRIPSFVWQDYGGREPITFADGSARVAAQDHPALT
jgi:hypothetical protein